jgi:hypothetical protein
MMLGLEPAVVGGAEPAEGSKFDHGLLLGNSVDPLDKRSAHVHK